MGLKDLKSLYDRHNKDTLGSSVAGPNSTGPTPSEGAYYSGNMTSDSPFDTVRGLKMDQMVTLLKHEVTSGNTGQIYQPGTLDMNGNDFGEGFSNPLTGNYDGQYTNPDTDATF